MVEPLPFLQGFLGDYALAVTQALYFLVSFAVVYLVGRVTVVPVVDRFLDRRNLDRHAKTPLLKLAKFAVVFVAIAVAFGFAEYGNFLTSLATIAAAATLAIGFAMQDVIANFVAGVFIYTDKPFKIDDWIEWDGGNYGGIVDDIGLRVTRVRTFDNELLTVPNSQLTDGVIKNPVAHDELRLKVVFGIGYDADIQRATDILVEEAEDHPEIMDDPGPSVRLTELGDSSVGLQSRIWIADPSRSDYVRTRGEYVTAVKERFDAEGIDIPFPTRTLSGGVELTNVEHAAEPADD